MKKYILISLFLFLTGVSSAESLDLRNKFSIGGDIGYWFTAIKDPTSLKGTIGNFLIGIDASYGFSKETLVGISAGYWSWSKVSNVLNTDIEIKYTAIPVLLSILYKLDAGSSEIFPFFKMKLGINYFTIGNSSSVGATESSDIKVAFGGSLGVEFFLSKELSIGPEVGYLYGGYTDLNGITTTVSVRAYF